MKHHGLERGGRDQKHQPRKRCPKKSSTKPSVKKAPKAGGKLTPAQKAAVTVQLKSDVAEEAKKAERQSSRVTAEKRLAALPGALKDDYVVKKVGHLPFEVREPLLCSGLTSADGVLWCSVCYVRYGSTICTEPPCTCLSYYFPCNMEKHFALETRESFLIKISEHKKPARVEEKRRVKYFFLIERGVYVLGTGRRIKSVR